MSNISLIKYVGMISGGQDVDDIELIIDAKSDNVIEEKLLLLLLQLFFIAVSLLMLEIKEVLDLNNSDLLTT